MKILMPIFPRLLGRISFSAPINVNIMIGMTINCNRFRKIVPNGSITLIDGPIIAPRRIPAMKPMDIFNMKDVSRYTFHTLFIRITLFSKKLHCFLFTNHNQYKHILTFCWTLVWTKYLILCLRMNNYSYFETLCQTSHKSRRHEKSWILGVLQSKWRMG